MAKAYDTGIGLGSRDVSWVEAVRWYNEAVEAVNGEDEEGNYDGTMDDPQYILLARLAEMYRDAGNGLEQDYGAAGNVLHGPPSVNIILTCSLFSWLFYESRRGRYDCNEG